MKLSKEELLEKVKTYVGDRTDDESLEIIEDISDSFESSDSAEKIEEIKTEYESKLANLDNEWREKYKARFFSEKDKQDNDEPDTPDGGGDDDNDDEKTEYSDLFEEKED